MLTKTNTNKLANGYRQHKNDYRNDYHNLTNLIASPLTRDIFDIFFRDFPASNASRGVVSNGFTSISPKINVREGDAKFIVSSEVPGYETEEISVHVEDNVLHISGEKQAQEEESTDVSHRVEFHNNSFERSYKLPKNVVSSKIKASYKNGILDIEIPKRKKSGKVQIKVN